MNNSGKPFDYEINNRMIYVGGFKQSKCQMYIYYKYSTYGNKLFVLSYVDNCIFWHTYEELGEWFVDTLAKRFHVNLLGYEHWFMSISISQLRY